jgi:hypothetical protein
MLYGDRFRKPPGLFPDEYIEIRCFGSYEDNCVRAVLFRLIEASAEQQKWEQNDSPAFRSLLKLCENEAELKEIARNTVRMMSNSPGEKEQIWRNICELSTKYTSFVSINPNYPPSFEAMCTSAGFALNIIGTRISVKLPSVEIALYQHQRVLFLLYSTFTRESFLNYPCGHFCVKYDY